MRPYHQQLPGPQRWPPRNAAPPRARPFSSGSSARWSRPTHAQQWRSSATNTSVMSGLGAYRAQTFPRRSPAVQVAAPLRRQRGNAYESLRQPTPINARRQCDRVRLSRSQAPSLFAEHSRLPEIQDIDGGRFFGFLINLMPPQSMQALLDLTPPLKRICLIHLYDAYAQRNPQLIDEMMQYQHPDESTELGRRITGDND